MKLEPLIAIAAAIAGLAIVWRMVRQQQPVYPVWLPPSAPDFVTAQRVKVPDLVIQLEEQGTF